MQIFFLFTFSFAFTRRIIIIANSICTFIAINDLELQSIKRSYLIDTSKFDSFRLNDFEWIFFTSKRKRML